MFLVFVIFFMKVIYPKGWCNTSYIVTVSKPLASIFIILCLVICSLQQLFFLTLNGSMRWNKKGGRELTDLGCSREEFLGSRSVSFSCWAASTLRALMLPLESAAVRAGPPPASSPWGFTGLANFLLVASSCSEGGSADLEGPGHSVDPRKDSNSFVDRYFSTAVWYLGGWEKRWEESDSGLTPSWPQQYSLCEQPLWGHNFLCLWELAFFSFFF